MLNLSDTNFQNVGIKDFMNISGNMRFQATAEKIERAVFMLLKRKRYDAFSVKDICIEAGINRSSFYAHYNDINDLMMKIENGLAQKMQSVLAPMSEIATSAPSANPFAALFSFIYEYKDFYKSFMKSNTPSFFAPKAMEKQRLLLQTMSRRNDLNYSDSEINYHLHFFGGGLKAICEQWLLTNCCETPEEMERVIHNEYANNAKYFV